MQELTSKLGEATLIEEAILDKAVALAKKQGHNRVLAVVLATKPCFYKLWSMMEEAHKQKLPFFILHSGQHYDDLVGHGFSEFNFSEHLGANLQIRGDLSQKSAEMFIKAKELAAHFAEKYPDTIFVPYVNGDTVTAGIFPGAWLFATNRASIQGEAALRSMSPAGFRKLTGNESPEELVKMQWGGDWELNRTEPFPEQYDTFISAAACTHFFAPVKLNAEHLIREGYPEENIFTIGNTVVDAIEAKRKTKPPRSVFEEYPKLKQGKWLRVDIHRRGNLNKQRFTAIIETITQLVEEGEHVAFVELHAAKKALEAYGLRTQLEKLAEKENFLFTPLWKEWAHVVEFLDSESCWAILTDSGSMQEEMNILKKPCLTARFSTDRPETVQNKANLLVPPLKAQQMVAMILYAKKKEEILDTMRTAQPLYGEKVAEKIITQITGLFENKEPFFAWSHDQLDIYEENEFLDYL